MPRNITTQVIKRFRGLDVWTSFTNASPERATDLINVIPSGSGGLEKLRVPVTLSQDIAQGSGPDSYAQFSTGAGLRQVFSQFGATLGVYDVSWIFSFVSSFGPNGDGIFDYITANNLMFMCNGSINWKWTGTLLQQWGIFPPPFPPAVSTIAPPAATPVNIAAVSGTVAISNGIRDGAASKIVFTTATPAGFVTGDVVIVTGMADPSFDGTFTVLESTSPPTFVVYQFGPDAGPVAGGTVQIGGGGASGVSRTGNEVTVTTTTAHGRSTGDLITIAGVTDTTFDGNFQIDSIIDTVTFTYPQMGPTAFSGSGTETPRIAPVYALGGRSYRISYTNSVTGHVSNASLASAYTGNLDGSIEAVVSTTASTDPQVDGAILWATQDGGSDYYFDQSISFTPGTAPVFSDTVPDAALNTAILAPFNNDPPLVGKYLVTWLGRTFILNLVGDPQGIIYSGFEQILIGRPEESFPINNRLKLAIGADAIRGAGVITQGLVIFSQSNQMYLLSGTIQDITITAPVQLSAFLRQLPWSQGCFSHYSIAETPQGLVWLASDKTIQLYNGQGQPMPLSNAFNPILRRITIGSEANTRGCFFNFLEREWYCLTCAIDNSSTNNLMVIVDLDPDPEANVGAFLFSLEADHVAVVEDATGIRQLTISQQGFIKQVIALSDTVNGISNPITATSATLGAYWLSGPFGNDAPQVIKMFRWSTIVTDQQDFRVEVSLIEEDNNFRYPTILPFAQLDFTGRFSVNAKARRAQYKVRFPDSDVSANILELSSSYIPVAER